MGPVAVASEVRRPRTAARALPPRQFLRWARRQLTSMRTAILLLLLPALASIPGSPLPQSGVKPRAVDSFRSAHPNLFPILEAVGGFAVFSSVWFSAIYLLLMV